MILVGITGKAGAGKDTIADYLVRERGFTKLSFAGPLKAMLAAAGMPEPMEREMKERPIPNFSFTWREAAQKLGTEWGRALDPQIWVKIVEQQIRRGLMETGGSARFVLSDVRFENEAAMVRQLGGRVLHIIGRAAELGGNAGHVSEAGLRAHADDAMIDNSGFLDVAVLQMHYAVFGGAA